MSLADGMAWEKEHGTDTPNLSQVFERASERQALKDLVWVIYSDPDKVKRAIEALKKIAEE